MHCRVCGYTLWNLTQPQCPECGTPFDLRTYRFTPGSVAFACPHCNALHGGGGDAFLPATTDTAICCACGQSMVVTHMRVVPLTDDAAASSGLMPWDDRASLGLFRAWGRTVKASMFAPTQLIRQLLPQSSIGSSLWFAILTYLFAALVQLIILLALLGIASAAIYFASGPIASALAHPGQQQASINVSGGWIVLGLLGVGLAVPVAVMTLSQVLLMPLLVFLFITLPAHLYLMLLQRRVSCFRVTARAAFYAQGPMVLLAFPVCGMYCCEVLWIWPLITTIIMIAAAHRIHGGHATLAVLWFPVTLVLCLIAWRIIDALAAQYHWF